MSGIKVRQDGETTPIATADVGGFKVEIGGEAKSVILVDVGHANETKIRCRVGGVVKSWKKAGEPFDVWIEDVAIEVYRKQGYAFTRHWEQGWDAAVAMFNADLWTLLDAEHFGFWGSGSIFGTKYLAWVDAYKGKIQFDLKNIPGGYDWEDVIVAELWLDTALETEYIHSISISPFGDFLHPIAPQGDFLKLDVLSYMGNENFEVEFTNSSYDPFTVKPLTPTVGNYYSKGGDVYNNDINVISHG